MIQNQLSQPLVKAANSIIDHLDFFQMAEGFFCDGRGKKLKPELILFSGFPIKHAWVFQLIAVWLNLCTSHFGLSRNFEFPADRRICLPFQKVMQG